MPDVDPYEVTPDPLPEDALAQDTARINIREARARLRKELRDLRFTAALSAPPAVAFDANRNEVEWLDAVTHWLHEFGMVLEDVSEINKSMIDELSRLKHERAVIRRFLGTENGGVTFNDGTPTRRRHDHPPHDYIETGYGNFDDGDDDTPDRQSEQQSD